MSNDNLKNMEYIVQADELRALIKASGLQKQFIARAINLHPCYLSILLSGKRKIPAHTKYRILEFIKSKSFF